MRYARHAPHHFVRSASVAQSTKERNSDCSPTHMPSRRHFLPQTERSHISPDILDVGQAFGPEALRTYLLPAEGRLPISRPYGVLLFVIDHNLVDGGVFCIVPHHSVPPKPQRLCGTSIGKSCRSPHSFHDPMKLRRFG